MVESNLPPERDQPAVLSSCHLKEPDKKISMQKQLTDLENEIYEPVKSIIQNYKEGITSKEELLQVKDYYFKKKYLHRLSHQLNGKL